MNDLSVVIVTYRRDLSLFERCIQSIATHSIVAPDINIVVVVNDDFALLNDIVALTAPLSININVLHYSELTDWTGHIGWDSQQYFKLAIANFVKTTWYLVLDSDNCLWDHVPASAIFVDNRASYLWTQTTDHHKNYLHNALLFWNSEPLDYSMGDSTPFVLHTATVRKLLQHTDPQWFNFDNQGALYTFEFFLYYAYLKYTNTLDILYFKKTTGPLIRGIQR